MTVGQSLGWVNMPYHWAHQTATACQTNPVPYKAMYFGEKLHIHQNKKLVKIHMFVPLMATQGWSLSSVQWA